MMHLFLFIVFGTILVVGMGHYLAYLIYDERNEKRKKLDSLERKLFQYFGWTNKSMDWKQYFKVIFALNILVGIIGLIILMTQGFYTDTPNMSFSLAFNTISSFMTNTNLQHYAGESQMSQLAQMVVIITHMFSSSATGIAVGFAFIRGITGSKNRLGNAYHDIFSIVIKLLIPLSFVIGLALVWQGVPQTFDNNIVISTINETQNVIKVGPVAAFEAIKHLGTNGGGYYAANASMPLENPTVISNMIEMLSMIMIPGGFVIAFGICSRKQKNVKGHLRSEALPIVIVMGILFAIGVFTMLRFENSGLDFVQPFNLNLSNNLEGKEMRFGIIDSVLFTGISTAFTTGSVNSMLDSYTPLAGMVPLIFMMLNVLFGGDGVGIMNIMMYVILTVFICGLMIGRTPEYLTKKIESYEMKRVALVILIHPILILVLTSIAVMTSGIPLDTHNFSRILYEFTSASANNGSGFEGLMDATIFFNISTGIVMIVGRFLPMILQLQIASSLLKKQSVAESTGTLQTNTLTFTVAFGVVVLVMSALTFFPVLMLGPISEALSMGIGG